MPWQLTIQKPNRLRTERRNGAEQVKAHIIE